MTFHHDPSAFRDHSPITHHPSDLRPSTFHVAYFTPCKQRRNWNYDERWRGRGGCKRTSVPRLVYPALIRSFIPWLITSLIAIYLFRDTSEATARRHNALLIINAVNSNANELFRSRFKWLKHRHTWFRVNDEPIPRNYAISIYIHTYIHRSK